MVEVECSVQQCRLWNYSHTHTGFSSVFALRPRQKLYRNLRFIVIFIHRIACVWFMYIAYNVACSSLPPLVPPAFVCLSVCLFVSISVSNVNTILIRSLRTFYERCIAGQENNTNFWKLSAFESWISEHRKTYTSYCSLLSIDHQMTINTAFPPCLAACWSSAIKC